MVHHRGQREGIYSSFVAEVHNDLKVTEGSTNREKVRVRVYKKNEMESEERESQRDRKKKSVTEDKEIRGTWSEGGWQREVKR